jgi:hypothetical protein
MLIIENLHNKETHISYKSQLFTIWIQTQVIQRVLYF